MEKVRENRKNKIESKKIKWELLPLQFILAVLPLIMYVYVGTSGYSAYEWNSLNDVYVDVFLHGKMMVFMVLALVILVLAVYKTVKIRRENRKKALCNFIPLFVYAFFVILATICSVNMNYSLHGSMDAKEPFGVLAGYVIVAFYTYLVIDSKDELMQVLPAAVFGGTCMAVLGVLQTIGKDPFGVEAVQHLFVSQEFIDTYGYLQLNFPVGQAYGTLFNPNYVGT